MADLVDWQAALDATEPTLRCRYGGTGMTDLIDRQAAIDAVECIVDHHSITPYQTMRAAIDHAKRIISGLPSAQPEIIRCKDCKHWKEGTVYSYCNKLFGMGVLDVYDYMTEEDDFCSRAERRTDETD